MMSKTAGSSSPLLYSLLSTSLWSSHVLEIYLISRVVMAVHIEGVRSHSFSSHASHSQGSSSRTRGYYRDNGSCRIALDAGLRLAISRDPRQ
ncbi:hypothetical protein BDV30DRAFT_206197 [Aspergillus minisclerotigenes]|uniref:Uncharacterized protein n=1 Tax=Aspergillus minisclerotigenes TaxID=656917 RepID=A0A5N6JFB8_9EURO|nr:hypothetical protein BDV30DRAFT_206197 [Aspergillus minisclerotigenes]